MKKSIFMVHIGLFGAFLLFQRLNLFAAPPLDGYVVPAGRSSGKTAQEARTMFLAAAESYQGTPYRYGGFDRNGLDCSGLVYASFKDSLAVSVPRSTSALYNWTEKISAAALQPGDLVFFITQGRNISHVGIYLGEGRFIHSASEGPKTGVIYSRLEESYWQRSFAGAGRALPEAALPEEGSGGVFVPAGASTASIASGSRTAPAPAAPVEIRGGLRPDRPGGRDSGGGGGSGGIQGKGFLAGIGFAPSWNSLADRNNPIRGVSTQIRFGWKGGVLGLVPGLEIRAEWDDALGVFRTALTPSLGFDDKLRIFAGPALSVGKPALDMKSGKRPYTGGNAWLGAAGVTIAPFSISLGRGRLDPYGELAWQYYQRGGGLDINRNADIGAGLRLSTGLRYTWDL
ncbi:MAG: C40 family peptidase [Treponema sp.]|nr:C40 family peptidase [Treponema sp.]